MTHYYEVGNELKAKIREAVAAGNKESRKARKLAKELGALECGYRDTYFGKNLCGFTFKEPPDQKLWKQIDRSKWWTPRLASKAGKELQKRMDAIKPFSQATVAKIIGMKIMNGLHVRSPGVVEKGDRMFLLLPPDVKPKGCTRLSDIEFEAASTRRRKHAG